MRQAMADAEVGGDALAGEDAGVRELEEAAATLFDKEAALLVCSGTMGNLVSLLAISQPGFMLIADPFTHIVSSEMRGFCRVARCTTIPVETDGILTGARVRECLNCHGVDNKIAAVICVENMHGLRGGIPWGPEVTADLIRVARERGLTLHIDGARIFNAAAATGATVAQLTAGADTVQVCLSKGLGAPIGSLILGTRQVIARARDCRQMLGGGMHKAGVIAAAGLVALREGPARIPDDHRRAKRLAALLADQSALVSATPVYTNIIDLLFDPHVLDGPRLVTLAAEQGLGIAGPWNASRGGWIRLVTHSEVTDADIEEAARVLLEVLGEAKLQ
jgi:threonine aldolase